MSAIIEAITSKPHWQLKIKDSSITKKWRKELHQQGITDNVYEKTLELLVKSTKEPEKNDWYDGPTPPFKWHLDVGARADEVWNTRCECECMICAGEEHLTLGLEEYEEDDEEYLETQNRLKKYKKIKCSCTNYCTNHTLAFLRKNIFHHMNMIKKDLKYRFLLNLKDYENRKEVVDYHPGSNNQMIDIIHPSLYCYVKGITEVSGSSKIDRLLRKSDSFQWIPSDFQVNRDSVGNPINTEIKSYINNLDYNNPVNHSLYENIGEIFTNMIPGFEKIVNNLKNTKKIHKIKGKEDTIPEIKLNNCKVIVKIANAIVNHENPTFSEGSWHMEGIKSEKIIATGIYYYSVKNIKKTYLRYRTTLSSDDIYALRYPQNCFEYVHYHYGMKLMDLKNGWDGAETTISLGKNETKENLCLFFPNFLQHRVSPIELKEGEIEGNRGILVFFLINPFESDSVISSENINPPQQETMSLEEAKAYRELLMFERKYEYSEQNKFHQRGISLCEH
jgi:hypothetical protein